MPKNGAKTHTSADLVSLIRTKYSGNAYCVLEQVANGTGAGTDSWIDAAVFSLWPSNGIWRAACEVKVSRADLLKELAKPGKNEWAREHFDFFWYVVAPGVAKDDEIPTGCGLMVVRGEGLAVVKQAPRRENVKTDNSIIASFARSLDKERERFVREGLRKALEESREYKTAMAWKEGTQRYLTHCGEHCYSETADDVFRELMKAARDKSPKGEEADHMLRVLENFKVHVLQFLLEVVPLASNVVNARDETAEFIVQRYGGRDDKSLEALKRLAATPGKHYLKDEAKRNLEVAQLLSGKEVARAS